MRERGSSLTLSRESWVDARPSRSELVGGCLSSREQLCWARLRSHRRTERRPPQRHRLNPVIQCIDYLTVKAAHRRYGLRWNRPPRAKTGNFEHVIGLAFLGHVDGDD